MKPPAPLPQIIPVAAGHGLRGLSAFSRRCLGSWCFFYVRPIAAWQQYTIIHLIHRQRKSGKPAKKYIFLHQVPIVSSSKWIKILIHRVDPSSDSRDSLQGMDVSGRASAIMIVQEVVSSFGCTDFNFMIPKFDTLCTYWTKGDSGIALGCTGMHWGFCPVFSACLSASFCCDQDELEMPK